MHRKRLKVLLRRRCLGTSRNLSSVTLGGECVNECENECANQKNRHISMPQLLRKLVTQKRVTWPLAKLYSHSLRSKRSRTNERAFSYHPLFVDFCALAPISARPAGEKLENLRSYGNATHAIWNKLLLLLLLARVRLYRHTLRKIPVRHIFVF